MIAISGRVDSQRIPKSNSVPDPGGEMDVFHPKDGGNNDSFNKTQDLLIGH